ncbi:MAG: translation initiation factor IF-2 [bacterium]|nr:translation initiation factor IF-2 [bacterium]
MNNTSHNHKLFTRPPIVVVMGHVDHGKSTLLDFIRKTKVVEGEAGGITQHIGAYEIEHTDNEGKKRRITFLDTPGHEAFSAIRSRGAKIADVAVLVVSAEDGVKPQTLEASRFIKENELAYIIAITKIDKSTADMEKTKQSLAENGIYIEGYGGDIPAVPVSSKTGEGVSDLLEILALSTDMQDLKMETGLPAKGVIIEAHRDSKKGITATLIVQEGTLKKGSTLIAGGSMSPVRIMENFQGKAISEALISSPARVVGWDIVPSVGEIFTAFESKREAEEEMRKKGRNASSGDLKTSRKPPISTIKRPQTSDATTKVQEDSEFERGVIPLVVKADTSGSAEAVLFEILKLSQDKVELRVISKGIGDIGENDVKLVARDDRAVILGFNVKADTRATRMAEQLGVTINTSDIIYKLSEWLASLVDARTPKTKVTEEMGKIKVLKIFSAEKDRQIIGCRISDGEIVQGNQVKILRRENEIGQGVIKELQLQKTKVSEVKALAEFGALFESKTEAAVGDTLVPFRVVMK